MHRKRLPERRILSFRKVRKKPLRLAAAPAVTNRSGLPDIPTGRRKVAHTRRASSLICSAQEPRAHVIRDPQSIPPDARAVLTIDLGALRANWRVLNQSSGSAECAGVVKADAYGLGLGEITAALIAEGCRTFFVATLTEARAIRIAHPGVAIYVLDGLLPGAAAHYAGFDLRPCLSSLDEIREWAAWCDATGRRLRAAVHIDTGMHRLGLSASDMELAAGPERGLFDHFEMSLVMSHLACADTPAHPMNRAQLDRFNRLRAKLPPAPASLANSGGVFLGPEYHFDLVRPGIALYGGRALEDRPNPMRWVVKLQARILQVRQVEKGAPIGYGATFIAERQSLVATLACGYADGFLRALSSPSGKPGPVGYVGDYPVPVVGRVSMDLITVDVTDVVDKQARRGGWVEVLGARTTIDDLTDRAGTIGYELLTRLGRRVHRVYAEEMR
ncbi:MAG: alanine racemase [Proteobacteria bacterium]|nr:alanine racemase [Pseudomonadota bacterium]